jgi:hypothetical protein
MTMSTELLFTVVPFDGIYKKDTVKLSIVVSPRLHGGDTLGNYPQTMLRWTRLLKNEGLTLALQAGSKQAHFEINRDLLQPDLWEALFTEKTPVKVYEFDNALIERANLGVASFSMRESLSLIKSIYREASVKLALPDDESSRIRERSNRDVLESLIGDLAVHWGDERNATTLRLKHLTRLPRDHASTSTTSELDMRVDRLSRLGSASVAKGSSLYDDEGYLDKGAIHSLDPDDKQNIAESCMAFHKMPTPTYSDKKVSKNQPPPKSNLTYDPEKIIDFHQSLSAIGNYPSLQRALGLVFDIELPIDELEITKNQQPFSLQIISHSLKDDFTPLKVKISTMYFLCDFGVQGHIFHTASRPGIFRGAFGVAALNPAWFGLSQVDIDGAMHKTVLLAESINKADNKADENVGKPSLAAHPEVYDPGATLPALRSGGLSLYADLRAMTWLVGLNQSATTNKLFEKGKEGQGEGEAVELYAEDITRGMRLDVWDDRTEVWHSLHERSAVYKFFTGDNIDNYVTFNPQQIGFDPALEEGWVESAVTRPAPGTPASEDHYYLHEAFARWAGWSLSAPRPDRALAADPMKGEPESNKEADAPTSPFKIKVEHDVRSGSLTALRFGRRYRLRGRWVNLAGLSTCVNDVEHAQSCLENPAGSWLSQWLSLPNVGRDGMMYRRFEPVASPQIVVAQKEAITGLGSTLHRLVIRTDNHSLSEDTNEADTVASSRHLLPPRVSVEMAERMGMFDDANGKILADESTWKLIALRDGEEPPEQPDPLDVSLRKGELPRVKATVAGQEKVFPLITAAFLAELPYLPDAWARGVALRNLPGLPSGSLARIDAVTASGPVAFERLNDPNPRPGSALLISFGGSNDWQAMQGLRLALSEPVGDSSAPPHWDAKTRTLTVFLIKGARSVVPVSCYLLPTDLPNMGVWQWFQEEASLLQRQDPQPPTLSPGKAVDELAHILQRTVEGGHWMLSPPVLIELIHALRQPLGLPVFQPLRVNSRIGLSKGFIIKQTFQTAITTSLLRPGEKDGIAASRRDPDELAALTGWRKLAATEAYLLGALKIHGVSTGRIDLLAKWDDPIDDPFKNPNSTGKERETRQSYVDRIDLPSLKEAYLPASDTPPPDIDQRVANINVDSDIRCVGYYDPEHDQIAFTLPGETSLPSENPLVFDRVAAPRHVIGDTRHHRISYSAVAVSRDADCFAPPDIGEAGFNRESAMLEVSIPASSRPLAPEVAYVLPTFGWQRQTDTSVKRSVRYGGGLRVYLKRPWFSSGDGELLGVTLWHGEDLDQSSRDRYKSYFTQWGMDPIWQTEQLTSAPTPWQFPDRQAQAHDVSLDEITNFNVDVVGYTVEFDPGRQLWYADLTIDTSNTYTPFVRLALVRYQPDALPDARLSRVVLADFAQLVPGRAVIVHPLQAHAKIIRVQISGIAPVGPNAIVEHYNKPKAIVPPTYFKVRVQEHIDGIDPELGWRDVILQVVDRATIIAFQPDGQSASFKLFIEPSKSTQTNLALWEGLVRFPEKTMSGHYRLLIEEYEAISNDKPTRANDSFAQGRLIFAEIVPIDSSLIDDR